MTSLINLLVIFGCSTAWLITLSKMAPSLVEFKEESIRFPTSFSDLSRLSALFQAYNKNNRLYMIILFTSAYLYKQAFCIPGSALLNVLGGAIFGLWTALPLCCVLTGVGATLSYLLSKQFVQQIVVHYWPEEVRSLKERVECNNQRLIPYLLSLRLLPFTPNWLLNLISPVVGIPLHYFFTTAFLGLIPYNYVCVQSGAMLSSFSSLNDVLTWETFLKLTFLSFMAFIIPKLIKHCTTISIT
ncbi:transmembrane protein 41A [Halyomorpha halys]|uniref:transmembrane protein 41A n=1 Tax=Halyomorpha halys TaxID=286706 RepID=UPI0006D4F20C|nr:transmembrane protein 41A-like [Halyomorpha halys]